MPPQTLPLKEFRRLDGNSAAHGVPIARLMQRAGETLAQSVLAQAPAAPVWLLCGKGNNGGDGFAAAGDLLLRGADVQVLLLAPPGDVQGPEARAQLDALPPSTVRAWNARLKPPPGAVLVDCLLGSGIRGAPRAPYSNAIRWLQRQKAARHRIVACDVPSGLGTPLAVRPHATITFHARKEGMTTANSGEVHVVDIGIPAEAARWIGPGDLDVGYPRMKPDAHKGQHGVVLVIGGGPYTGAPHYAGMAAYRTGADLVLLATPAEAARTISAWGPDLLVHATEPGDHFTEASLQTLQPLLDKAGAVVLGPGMGRHPGTDAFARRVVKEATKRDLPLVIDADPLASLDDKTLRPHAPRTVFTPHKREAKALTGGTSDKHLIQWAQERGTTLVRKGRTDMVAAATPRWCACGHPTMTVGGTGDVLTGIVAAPLAKGATPYDAACAAIYVNGRAGEIAGEELGPGATATDILERIPRILRDL